MKRTLALFLLAGLPALADVSGISNTGINVSGGLDLSWTVSGPGITGTSAASLVTSQPGSWLADTADSSWIGPQADANAGNPPQIGDQTCTPNCNYTYTTSFWISSTSGTPTLNLNWVADNGLVDVNVNGIDNTTGLPTNTTDLNESYFNQFQSFTITGGGLKLGLNTLEFEVNNFGYPSTGWTGGATNPTGLQVQFVSASNLTVPEPSAFVLLPLMLGALFALVGLRKRLTA
jgi:hypothetical protein